MVTGAAGSTTGRAGSCLSAATRSASSPCVRVSFGRNEPTLLAISPRATTSLISGWAQERPVLAGVAVAAVAKATSRQASRVSRRSRLTPTASSDPPASFNLRRDGDRDHARADARGARCASGGARRARAARRRRLRKRLAARRAVRERRLGRLRTSGGAPGRIASEQPRRQARIVEPGDPGQDEGDDEGPLGDALVERTGRG